MLLVNSDIFSIVSGHRNYFMDQKENYNTEVKRYTDLYETVSFNNHQLEKELKNLKKEYEMERERLEKEIHYFKEKLSRVEEDKAVQTDMDYMELNKILKNHHLISYQKSLVIYFI